MTWWQWLASAWVALAVIGTLVLYVGYGFTMSAIRAHKDGLSLPHVYAIDAAIAGAFTLLDGVLNALVYSIICLDFRPSYAFRMVTVKGLTFPFFELITERLSRYSENKTEWRWRRGVAVFFAAFLDGKDRKGWHVRR